MVLFGSQSQRLESLVLGPTDFWTPGEADHDGSENMLGKKMFISWKTGSKSAGRVQGKKSPKGYPQ